ncbi:cupin domain-containing protein, partial [Streptomyces stelliscabiei]
MSVSPVVPPASAPTLSGPTQAELLDFARRTAADGELIASLPLDPEGRTWVRLEGPGGSEAWLIGWPPGTGTGW